jgi:adenylosuccinate lyase
MTTHHSINALSPLDGRYFSQTNVLANFFSESALLKYRLKIEIEYLINFLPLSGQKKDVLTEQEKKEIRNI